MGVDIRQQRPYRAALASEDTDSGFFAGPPFKLQVMNHDSEKFVNMLRYAPDGSFYAPVDAGGKIFLYDGKEGSLKHEINGGEDKAHAGGIYGLSWSADSKQFITASADKTVKQWDAESNKLVKTFT